MGKSMYANKEHKLIYYLAETKIDFKRNYIKRNKNVEAYFANTLEIFYNRVTATVVAWKKAQASESERRVPCSGFVTNCIRQRCQII